MADTHIAFYSFDEVVATCGGRLDFEEFEEYEQEIDFSEMDEMLNMLANASIELTGTPLPLKSIFLCAERTANGRKSGLPGWWTGSIKI